VNALERLRALVERRDEPAPVERTLTHRFQFLVEEQGFELARSDTLRDGAIAAYKNVPARRAVMVLARADRGVWAGVGRLDETGQMSALDRNAIADGRWRPLGTVNLGPTVHSLEDAIERLAELLRTSRA
jgi:hypothetical protein